MLKIMLLYFYEALVTVLTATFIGMIIGAINSYLVL